MLLEIFERLDKVTKSNCDYNFLQEHKNSFLNQIEYEINNFKGNYESNIISYIKKFGELRHQLKIN